MTPHPSKVRVLVANRDPRGGEPIDLEHVDGKLSLEPGKTGQVVLAWQGFLSLHALQPAATRREPGVLRLVDFWTEVDGQRHEVDVPRQDAD